MKLHPHRDAVVLLLGFDEAGPKVFDEFVRAHDCKLHVESEVDAAVLAVSSTQFAVIVVRMGGAEMLRTVELLSQDVQTRRTPMLVVGDFSQAQLAAVALLRDGPFEVVRNDESDFWLSRRLGLLLQINGLRLREQQLLRTLAFKQGELETESESRRKAELAVAHRSSHDPLTELPNRSLFEDRLAMGIERAQRSGQKLGLMYLDIKGFRPVNEGYGHRMGDLLLSSMGRRIHETIRRSDTVSRIAGDEFGVIAENIHDEETLVQLGEKLLEVLSLPFSLGHEDGSEPTVVQIDAYLGIAIFPRQSTQAALMKAADRAMAEAKSSNSSRPVFV